MGWQWRNPRRSVRRRLPSLPGRSILAAGLLALLGAWLLGYGQLGIGHSDPELLAERYVDERSRFVRISGARVHVREEGVPRGVPVLLLHGVNGSLHVWEPWVDRLRQRYRVISVDLPPWGLSGPLPGAGYDGPEMTRLLGALLDELAIGPAIVIGHSLGGYYAAYLAAHEPARVQALVLVAPAGYPQAAPPWLHLAALPVVGEVSQWILPRPLVRLAMSSLYAQPQRLDEASVQRQYDLMRAPDNRGHARDVLRMLLAYRDRQPHWVSRIEQPTLLLWGEQDGWIPIEQAGRWLDDLNSARLVRYPDAGHVPMEELAERSAADLLEFLALLNERTPGLATAHR